MNDKNRNLLLRAVSALVLLPIVLFLLWKGGLYTVVLVGFASAVVASELFAMVGLSWKHPAAIAGMLGAASFAYFAIDLSARWPGALGVAAFAPILGFALLTLDPPNGDLKKAAVLAPVAAIAPTYAGLCLSAVAGLREMPDGSGFLWIFVALAVTWGNDTGAYFAGRFLGRHKLYPEVSPSKTWEGFWGGMVASVAILFLTRATIFPALRPMDCVLLGVVAGALGPIGDLAESMLKRAYGVKDSGKIMPGHGGMFDRLDALLFNAPWVFAYARFLLERL